MNQQGASDPDEAPDPLIGRTINQRYEIVVAIAAGGMGRVYRARQMPLGREVALKVLQPNYHGNADPGFHKRFFLEAATLARLKCPNTVTVFDYGSEDSIYYIAMELLKGRTLHRELRRLGHLPVERVFSISRQICRSLGEAHALGIVHRDLKPANIFLVARAEDAHEEERDLVKVIDFGLVKQLDDGGDALTKSGLFMGSPKYMSPEQIRNHEVDPRSDVYAIGVVIYEMLTGRAPFVGKSDIDTLTAHLGQPPPAMATVNPVAAAAIPPEIESVVRKALAKSPDARFETTDELYVAMKVAIATRMSVTPTGPWMTAPGTDTVTPSGVQRLPDDDTPTATKEPQADDVMIEIALADGSPRRRWLPIALLGLAAAGVATSVALGALDQGERAAPADEAIPVNTSRPAVEPEPPETVPQPAPPQVEAPSPTPETPSRVRLRLTSDPSGAVALIDGRVYGPTPAEIELVGDEYVEGSSVSVQFQKEGYRDAVVTVPVADDTLDIGATLEPYVRHQWRPRGPPSSSESAPSGMWSPI